MAYLKGYDIHHVSYQGGYVATWLAKLVVAIDRDVPVEVL